MRRPARLKNFGVAVGLGAVAAAVSFTLSHLDNSADVGSVPDRGGVLVASGNHNPTFTPPQVPVMDMGASVVETTPSSVLPTEKAVPLVKAGH